jgi:voltage-gated potassium channel
VPSEHRRDDLTDVRRRLARAALATAFVFLVGVAGYAIIGRSTSSFVDAVYMTVITLTTVGYGEIIPLDGKPGGRIFTMLLLLAGVGVLVYFTSTVTAFFVEGHVTRVFWRNRMRKAIEGLSDHFIVCGTGGIADSVVAELIRVGLRVVVVAPEGSLVSPEDTDVLRVFGDPSDEAILNDAGILRAAGLVAALDSDQANIVTTLTAREASSTLRIVAMVTEMRNETKFRRAGANEVVNPTAIGGLRLASALIRPTVVTFLDSMLRVRDRQLSIDEVVIPPGSSAVGKQVGSLAINALPGLLLLAVVEPDRTTRHFKPAEELVLEAGSALIIMGSAAEVGALRGRLGTGVS